MIKIAKIVQSCIACPQQWEALADDGRIVYIRERWDNLSVGIGNTLDEAVSEDIYKTIIPNCQLLSYADLQQHLGHILDFSDMDVLSLYEYEEGFQTHSEDSE